MPFRTCPRDLSGYAVKLAGLLVDLASLELQNRFYQGSSCVFCGALLEYKLVSERHKLEP